MNLGSDDWRKPQLQLPHKRYRIPCRFGGKCRYRLSTFLLFGWPLFGWLLFVTGGSADAQTPASPQKNILVIGSEPDHEFGNHMYAFDCQVLVRCLQQNPGVKADYSLGWPTNAKQFAGLDAIVFYSSPAGEIVLAPERRDQFSQLMKTGVGYAAIHWATSVGYSKLADSQQLRDEYRRTLGGWFRRPPCDIAITRTALQFAGDNHPILQGWQPFDLHDEFYLNLVFDERAQPLLQIRLDDKTQTVAWTFDRPAPAAGRSFGTVMGHFHNNFARPEFRRMLVNGILWTAHYPIPATGANVELPAEAFVLPEPDAESLTP